jgi:hypothetical protein
MPPVDIHSGPQMQSRRYGHIRPQWTNYLLEFCFMKDPMQLTSTLVICPQATKSRTCCWGQLGDKIVEAEWLIKWCEKLETSIITSHHGEVHHLLQATSSIYAQVFWGFKNLIKFCNCARYVTNKSQLHLGYCCRISLYFLAANDTNCLPNTWIALEHSGRKQFAIMFLSWNHSWWRAGVWALITDFLTLFMIIMYVFCWPSVCGH